MPETHSNPAAAGPNAAPEVVVSATPLEPAAFGTESASPCGEWTPETERLRLPPVESFPEDLGDLSVPELQILDSQIQRQLAHEYSVQGQPNPETEFRNWELDAEFDQRNP